MSNTQECEGHDCGSHDEDFISSGDDELLRKKRDVSDEERTEYEETDRINTYTARQHQYSGHHEKYGRRRHRKMERSLVLMPDRQSYYITKPNTSNWRCGTPANKILLNPTGKMAKKEYDLVHQQFVAAVLTGVTLNYQVQKIEKIVNGCTWKKYRRSCEKIRSEAGHLNERMLFHGSNSFQDIIENGFDERYARNGLYGFGVYFSPLSSKSNGYMSANSTGEKHMLLCRVALGKVFRSPGYKQYFHPPPGYNAVEGTPIAITNDCTEIIVYRGEQAYPEYLITYKV